MKNHTFLLTIMLSWSILSVAQTDTVHQKKMHFSIAPSIIITHLSNPSTDMIETETQPSLAAAFLVNYDLTERLTFSSGIDIVSVWFDYKDYGATFGCDIDPVNGIDFKNSWVSVNTHAQYAGIPLAMKYKVMKTASYPYLGVDVKFLYLLYDQTRMDFYECGNQTISADVGSQSQNLQILPGAFIGYSQSLKKNVSIFAELHAHTPMNLQLGMFAPPVSTPATIIGASLGVSF